MKKNLFFFVFTFLFSALTIQAQNFFDDFEAYVAGIQLVVQNPVDWNTWSGPPGTGEDPFVSNAFAYSGSNSVRIIQNNDLVKPLGSETTGRWYMSFWIYIPTGKAGYFNTMNGFTPNPFQWGMEVYFDAGGGGRLVNAATTNFTWTPNTWQFVQVIIDLDIDEAQFWFNGSQVGTSWQWTRGNPGSYALRLDAQDLFGATANDEMFFDNYWFGDQPVPVELTSFTAAAHNGFVQLNWTTATEINNQMFEVQRQSLDGEFFTIGFVNGHGTTTEPQEYSYIDQTVTTGTYSYRLKQIDYDGRFSYSPTVEVDVLLTNFALEQNYPNPFNPSTNIRFGVPEGGFIRLSVFNIVGEEVAVLVNGNVEAGIHNVTFDARDLSSGTYIYKLQSANSTEVKKMLLMK